MSSIFEIALQEVNSGMVLGLGSGRAALSFVRSLGQKVAQGLSVTGIPTSSETAALAVEMGIPLVSLAELGGRPIDLTVDGADEVDPELNLIKGYGRALVREKVIAASSKRLVILVGTEKLVNNLGDRGRLPVEVVSFALPLLLKKLEEWGSHGVVWQGVSGPNLSDNGNPIVDCTTNGIENLGCLANRIRNLPGVVDTGFFQNMANRVLVGDEKHGFEFCQAMDRGPAA